MPGVVNTSFPSREWDLPLQVNKWVVWLQVILSGIWIVWIDFTNAWFCRKTKSNFYCKPAEFNIWPFLVCSTRASACLLTMTIPLCFPLFSLPLRCSKTQILDTKESKYIASSTNHNFTYMLIASWPLFSCNDEELREQTYTASSTVTHSQPFNQSSIPFCLLQRGEKDFPLPSCIFPIPQKFITWQR